MNAQGRDGAPVIGGVVDAVAAAIREHRPGTKRVNHPWRKGYLLNLTACKGCEWAEEDGDHDAHVAAAVVEALALTPEFAHMGQPDPDEDPQLDEWSCGHQIITPGKNYGVVHEGYDEPVQRFVSPWVSVVRGTTQ